MKHTSGAHVLVRGPVALKYGTGAVGARVGQQREYIQHFRRLGCIRLPRVLAGGSNWYLMERLHEVPVADTRQIKEDYAWSILTVLRATVWPRILVGRHVNLGAHYHYLNSLRPHAGDVNIDHLLHVADRIYWGSLTPAMTHGDTTFDNLMARDSGQFVLIDPLPPYVDERIPFLQVTDIGKIIQSLMGYEDIKYGRPLQPGNVMRFLDCIDKEERGAALYMAGVHFARLLSYQPKALRPQFIKMISDCALDALSLL